MAALTREKDAELIGVLAAAGAEIHVGALVVANASGYAAPGSTAAGLTCIGRAESAAKNTGAAAQPLAGAEMVSGGTVFWRDSSGRSI